MSDSENERDASVAMAVAASSILIIAAMKLKKKKKKRSVWVRKLLKERQRGQFSQLILNELQVNKDDDHMRMNFEQFKVRQVNKLEM